MTFSESNDWMEIYNWLIFERNPVQDVCHGLSSLAVKITEELKFCVAVAETSSKRIFQ